MRLVDWKVKMKSEERRKISAYAEIHIFFSPFSFISSLPAKAFFDAARRGRVSRDTLYAQPFHSRITLFLLKID